jgi:hypothetical protein
MWVAKADPADGQKGRVASFGVGKKAGNIYRNLRSLAARVMKSALVSRLKQYKSEKLVLGFVSTGILLRAPQIAMVLRAGSTLSRAMAGFVISAFLLRALPFLERAVRKKVRKFLLRLHRAKRVPVRTLRRIDRAFIRASRGIDRNVYKSASMQMAFTAGPKVFMGLNAAGSIANGYLNNNWYSVAGGAAYLTGLVLMLVAQRHFNNSAPAPVGLDIPGPGRA